MTRPIVSLSASARVDIWIREQLEGQPPLTPGESDRLERAYLRGGNQLMLHELGQLLSDRRAPERRREAARGFRWAKRSRKAPTAAIGRERPAWQRQAGHRGIETLEQRAARTRRGHLLPQRMRAGRLSVERRRAEQAHAAGWRIP